MQTAMTRTVMPGYFEALGIHLGCQAFALPPTLLDPSLFGNQ